MAAPMGEPAEVLMAMATPVRGAGRSFDGDGDSPYGEPAAIAG